MISSLPAFVFTVTELAAHLVATRLAMPIDRRNTDTRTGQRLNLTCFSRSAPAPRDLPRQNNASHQLRCRHLSGLASTPWQLSP
jgi:hypothetical protein